MSEKGPASPESKDPYYIEGLPEVLQISSIDELRREQAKREGELLFAADFNDPDARKAAKEAAYAEFDQMIENHLTKNGIPKDHDKHDEYAALLRGYSVDHIPQNIWQNGQLDEDGKEVIPVMRTSAYHEVNEKYAPKEKKEGDEETKPEPVAEPSPEPEPTSEPESDNPDKKKTPEEIKDIVDKDIAVIAARQGVDNLRSQLAKLSAKRQGRLFNRQGGKLQEEYDKVETEYKRAVARLTSIELNAEKTAGLELSEEDERLEAAFRVVKQFRNLQSEAVETLKNTKVGKMITWLTTGGTVKRLAKGLLVGGAVGAVGAAITAFTLGTAGGAVGAGLAFAGARATAFARGFAAFDNMHGRGMGVVDIEDENNPNANFNIRTMREAGAEGKSRDEAIDLVHQHLMTRFENDTKIEQDKRRKSTLKALGVMAIGAAVAEGISLGVNVFSGHIEGAHGLISGNPDAHDQPVGGPAPVEVSPPPAVPETVYSPDALNINAGEGWYQTFKDMGIPKDQWHDLLGKVGPQLHDVQVDGHPLAYHMPNGDWGIRMTADGHMPKSALDLISHAHDQMNGINNPVPAGAGIEASTGATPSGSSLVEAAQNTTPGTPTSVDTLTAHTDHSGIQNIIHKQVIQPSDIQGNPNFTTFTHVSGMTPEMMGQHLGLRATEWDHLQDYIARQVTIDHNALYDNVFTVNPDGFLRFTTSNIPPATMADMLNNGIPAGVRARL